MGGTTLNSCCSKMKTISHSNATSALWVIKSVLTEVSSNDGIPPLKGGVVLISVGQDLDYYKRFGIPSRCNFHSLLEMKDPPKSVRDLEVVLIKWAKEAPNVVIDGIHLLKFILDGDNRSVIEMLLRIGDRITGEVWVSFDGGVMGESDSMQYIHLSTVSVSLEPLDTGRADDVTGVVTIAGDGTIKRSLYSVSKEGQMKII